MSLHSNSKDTQALRLLLPIFSTSCIPGAQRKDSRSLCPGEAPPRHKERADNRGPSEERAGRLTRFRKNKRYHLPMRAAPQVNAGLTWTKEQSPARPRGPRALARRDQRRSSARQRREFISRKEATGNPKCSSLARPLPGRLPVRCKNQHPQELTSVIR